MKPKECCEIQTFFSYKNDITERRIIKETDFPFPLSLSTTRGLWLVLPRSCWGLSWAWSQVARCSSRERNSCPVCAVPGLRFARGGGPPIAGVLGVEVDETRVALLGSRCLGSAAGWETGSWVWPRHAILPGP